MSHVVNVQRGLHLHMIFAFIENRSIGVINLQAVYTAHQIRTQLLDNSRLLLRCQDMSSC